MSTWRLELLRLWRTRRALALTAVFVVFGLVGPVIASRLPELARAAGGNIVMIVPPPTSADGVAQYTRNAMQIGLVVALIVAGAGLSLDGRPALGVFYRTRCRRSIDLMLARYVVPTAATIAAFAAGTLAAWYETSVLIGAVPAGRLLVGVAVQSVYFAYALAIVALTAALTRAAITSVGIALLVLLSTPLLGTVPALEPWLPSRLAGAVDGVVRGDGVGDYQGCLLVAAIAIGVLCTLSVRAVDRREV